jgi:hypothetical protein
LITAVGEKTASKDAGITTCTTDPWASGSDPWAQFAKIAVAKKAKKEELGEDLAEGFGLGTTYTATSSSAASASASMALSAEAAAIIAAVNQNTDQKVALVSGRRARHECLIVDLGARVVTLGREKNLGVYWKRLQRRCGIYCGWSFDVAL